MEVDDLINGSFLDSLGEEEFKSPADYEKEIYDLHQLLEISRSLCTTLELPNLIESILYVTMAQMRVLGAGIFILQSMDGQAYHLGTNYSGFEIDPSLDYIIPVESPLAEFVCVRGKVFTLEDLQARFPDHKDVQLVATLQPTLIVPLVLKNHLNGMLILGERIAADAEDAAYSDYEKTEISTIASLAAVAINNASLMELSSTDMMTHLKLKYYFFNVLTDKLDSAAAQNAMLSVLMFDIDFFKKFNDTYGHACGDYVLQTVAQIIKNSIRTQDMASRYGGEEFTVMLGGANKKDALVVAERIRRNIEEHDFFYQDTHMRVTISGGVAVFSRESNPVTSAKVLVDQADRALYISKRNGRNRITFADASVIAAMDVMPKEAPSAH